MKLQNATTTMTQAQVEELKEAMIGKKITKGAAFRQMFADGFSVNEIAKALDVKYTHVYNVCKNEVLVHGLDVETGRQNDENSKRNQIVQALQEGKSMSAVAQEFKCMYNYVWQVAKANGLTKKQQEAAAIEAADAKKTSKKARKTA